MKIDEFYGLSTYEERFVKDLAQGASAINHTNPGAADQLISLMVDGICNFKDEWYRRGYGELKTHLTPVLLLDKPRIMELCDIIPLNPGPMLNEFGLAWLDIIYHPKKHMFITIGTPTFYIVESLDNAKLVCEEVAYGSREYDLTPLGTTQEAGIDVMKCIFDSNSFWKTLVSYIKREPMAHRWLNYMVKKGYAKKLK